MIVKYAHETAPQCLIGNMFNLHHLYPETPSPSDALRAHQESEFNMFFCDVMAKGYYPKWILSYYRKNNIHIKWYDNYEKILAQGKVDFISLSYYLSSIVTADPKRQERIGSFIRTLHNPHIETSDFGWQIDPTALRISLNELRDRFDLPIYIVENGIGAFEELNEDKTVHDNYRIAYLRSHIEAIAEAVIPVAQPDHRLRADDLQAGADCHPQTGIALELNLEAGISARQPMDVIQRARLLRFRRAEHSLHKRCRQALRRNGVGG